MSFAMKALVTQFLDAGFLPVVSPQLPNWAEALTALFSVATLIAVVLAAVQIRHVNRQMHRELEMQYLLRFWALTDRLSDKFKLKGIPTKTDTAVLREYLSLSEDQIALRSLGRVTNHTWEYWRHDIRTMCAKGAIRDELSKTPVAEYMHVRALLDDEKYDPLAHGRVWRHLQGL